MKTHLNSLVAGVLVLLGFGGLVSHACTQEDEINVLRAHVQAMRTEVAQSKQFMQSLEKAVQDLRTADEHLQANDQQLANAINKGQGVRYSP